MGNIERYFNIIDNGGFYDVGLEPHPSPEQLLVVASTGSGKTILVNSIASNLKHYRGTKVIYLTEKTKASAMENCFCGIETQNINQIKMMQEDLMWNVAVKREKIEVYHPFTFNFPKTSIPNVIKLFTLPITEISELGFSGLLGREIDSPTVNLCKEVITDLNSDDDIFSFLLKAFDKSSVVQEESGVRVRKSNKYPYLPIDSYGSKRDIEQIRVMFKVFEKDCVLQDGNCELNLTDEKFIEILNDVETTTFFTLWKITDEKLRYFICLELLKKIYRVLPDNAKHPVLIVFEEVKVLLPKSIKLKYQAILCDELVRMLAEIRTAGRGTTCIFTTQSYYETNPQLRDAISEVILMRLGHEDQSSFGREGLTSANYDALTKLRKGESVFLKDIKNRSESASGYRVFYVPFAHREPGLPFFCDYWKKIYPEEMISYRDTINSMEEDFEKRKKIAIEKQDEYLEKYKKKTNEKKEIKEIEKAGNPDEDFVEDIITEPKQVVSLEIKKKCYDLALNTPKATWVGRAKTELVENVNDPMELHKLAVEYAISVGDYNFIKQFSQKKFVSKHFSEYYDDIFPAD